MLTSIKVYDSFAVVNFGVDKILLAIRPEVEGQYALYNDIITNVGDKRRDTLHLSSHISQKPLDYFVIPDQTQYYDYLLNIITQATSDNTKYIIQEGIDLDPTIPQALFT